MKKTLSIVLVAIMLCSMLTVFASAETKVPDYDAAKNGDILYTVDFSGTDGIYKPFVFRMADKKMESTTVTVKDDGKTLTAKSPSSAGKAWFYGGAIKGLTLGEGKQYTIEFTATFPKSNAGMYFNFANRTEGDGVVATSDQTYNGLYGVYGNLSGATFTLSRGAGGRINGDLISSSAAYTSAPVIVSNGIEANIRIEIDGWFYSVFVENQLYDHVYMKDISKCSFEAASNLGFSVYLYNANQETTVKNVTIKKGCSYTAAENCPKYVAPEGPELDKIDYSAAKYGDKLTDLLFNSTTGAFRPKEIAKNATNTTTISADGKSYTSAIGTTAAAEWFGGSIGGLKITDDTLYTFKYKIKNTGSTYAVGVAYNSVAAFPTYSYKLNWYGTFTNSELTFKLRGSETANACNGVKYAFNGVNFVATNYGSETTEAFEAAPYVDNDGFSEVAVELEGWTWTYYAKQADGSYKKLSTVDNNKLLGEFATTTDDLQANDLSLYIYTYNKNISATVKDVSVYKGVVVSDPTGAQHQPATGDNAVWVVAIAMVSLFGMGIAFKAVKH